MIIVKLLFIIAFAHIVFTKYTIVLDTRQVKQSTYLLDINQTTLQQNQSQLLQNYYNYQYIGKIKVLQQNTIQSFNVIFDTGSSQMWLPSRDCYRCNKQNQGMICEQPTCLQSSETASINYHVGALIGIKCLGMFSIEQNFMESQFILVDEVQGMEGAFYDGVIGLSQQSNHSFIEWPISFYYNFDHSDKQSSITFGGYDNTLFDKEIRYIKSNESWIIQSQQIDINGIIGVDNYAMIDSGSSLLIFPKQILINLQQIYQNCIWTDIIKCSCPTNDISQYPTIKILLDQQEFTLEPEFYIQTNLQEPYCYILISNIRTYNDKLIILGSPFMRKYYSIFDKANSQIGLVESIHTFHISQQNFIKNLFTIIGCIILALTIIKIVNIFMDYELKKQNNSKSLMV